MLSRKYDSGFQPRYETGRTLELTNLDPGVYKSQIAYAWVMELVDIRDLKSLGTMSRGGSTPPPGTNRITSLAPTSIFYDPAPLVDDSLISCRPHLYTEQGYEREEEAIK